MGKMKLKSIKNERQKNTAKSLTKQRAERRKLKEKGHGDK